MATKAITIELSASEREIVVSALETLSAVYKRRVNAEKSQAIRELVDAQRRDVDALRTRV